MKYRVLTSVLLLTFSVQAEYPYNDWEEDYTAQALLGAVKFDHLKFPVDDSESPEQIKISTLPQLGGAWTTLPVGDRIQFGLEASFLTGFQVDKLNYLYFGGAGLQVDLSFRMWLFDLAGGAYLNLFPDKEHRVRIYTGAGPLLSYADYRIEKEFSDADPNNPSPTATEDESISRSAFGVGFYARTGVEFRVHEKGLFGLGMRASWMNMDFTDIGGRTELTGLAAFVTYTAGF
jgi:hypothetical protein